MGGGKGGSEMATVVRVRMGWMTSDCVLLIISNLFQRSLPPSTLSSEIYPYPVFPSNSCLCPLISCDVHAMRAGRSLGLSTFIPRRNLDLDHLKSLTSIRCSHPPLLFVHLTPPLQSNLNVSTEVLSVPNTEARIIFPKRAFRSDIRECLHY